MAVSLPGVPVLDLEGTARRGAGCRVFTQDCDALHFGSTHKITLRRCIVDLEAGRSGQECRRGVNSLGLPPRSPRRTGMTKPTVHYSESEWQAARAQAEQLAEARALVESIPPGNYAVSGRCFQIEHAASPWLAV